MTVLERLRKKSSFLMLLGEQGFESLDQMLRNAISSEFNGEFFLRDFSDSEAILHKVPQKDAPISFESEELYAIEYTVTKSGEVQLIGSPEKVVRVVSYELESPTENETLTSKLGKVYSKIVEIKRVGEGSLTEYGVVGMKWGNRKDTEGQTQSGRDRLAAHVKAVRAHIRSKGRSWGGERPVVSLGKSRMQLATTLKVLRSAGLKNTARSISKKTDSPRINFAAYKSK